MRLAESIEVLSANVLHCSGNRYGSIAHRRHTHQQVDDLFFVIGEAVSVELLTDGWVVGFLFFVLVENPFERGAVAESVIPSFGWDAGQGRFAVDDDPTSLFVGFQDALWREPGFVYFLVRQVNALKLGLRHRLVADV